MSAALLERLRMCVAEAGYSPDLVSEHPLSWCGVAGHVGIPHFVWWRAGVLCGVTQRCWPCVRDNRRVCLGEPAPQPCGHPIDPFCSEDAEAAW